MPYLRSICRRSNCRRSKCRIFGAIVGRAIVGGANVAGAIVGGAIVGGANVGGASVAGANVSEYLSRSICRIYRSNCQRSICRRSICRVTVWNTLLSCSWKPPMYVRRSDIMFLKPNWSPLHGLIYAHLTSTLRCHWDCGAHDHVQGVVPMLSIASQCIHVTIPLFSSERRLAAQSALVLSLLKEAPLFCA